MNKAIITWLSAVAGAVAAVAAQAESPGELQPAAGERASIVLQAAGVQMYECRSTGTPMRYEWNFVAPEADLYDASGERVGRHYAGPTWESLGGSRVTAMLAAKAAAPSPDSIAWLRLTANAERTPGMFGGVTSIHRLGTVGGAAPKEGCGPASVGTQARVPYAAQYVFFTR